MIPFHKLINIVFGVGIVNLCTFFYNVYRGPSYSPITTGNIGLSPSQMRVLGLSAARQYPGMYQLGNQDLYYTNQRFYQPSQSGTYYLNDLGTGTRFSPYEGDVKGFITGEEKGTYEPSIAYITAQQAGMGANKPSSFRPSGNIGLYQPYQQSFNPYQYGGGFTPYGLGRYFGNQFGSPIQFGAPRISTGQQMSAGGKGVPSQAGQSGTQTGGLGGGK